MKVIALAVAALSAGALAANAQDWSGWSIGLAAGGGNGENINPFEMADVSGSTVGGFVGYTMQQGNLVYGAELAASTADIQFEDCGVCVYKGFVDLKGRVGYSAGRTLFFGVLGYSMDTYEEPNVESKGGGVVYGLGMDVMLSDRVILGAEVLRRDLTHDTQGFVPFEAEITTVTARIGFKF